MFEKYEHRPKEDLLLPSSIQDSCTYVSILCLISSFSVSFEFVCCFRLYIREIVFIKELITVNEPTITFSVINCHLSLCKLRLNGVFTI